jgi:hypothetical protein
MKIMLGFFWVLDVSLVLHAKIKIEKRRKIGKDRLLKKSDIGYILLLKNSEYDKVSKKVLSNNL